MNSVADLRSIAFDLNSHQASDDRPQSFLAFRERTTDYSKYLRTIAGLNTPISCAVVCTSLDLIFTLIALVIGATNTAACPIEYRIPIYLIVSGTINLASISFTVVAYIVHMKAREENISGFFYVIVSSLMIITFQLVNLVWLFLGTVWLFSVLNEVQFTDMNSTTYCQENLYRYTEVTIILQYIIPLLICCCKTIPLLKR